MSKSTKSDRPKKPRKDFPLYPHPSGKWAAKLAGKFCYFGAWARTVDGKLVRVENDGWQQAEEEYNRRAAGFHSGLRVANELTVKELVNRFLTMKLQAVEEGEIVRRTFDEYREFSERVAAKFGKDRLVADLTPDDFSSLRADAKKIWGVYRLGKYVQCVRTLFAFAYDERLIDRPVWFGSKFVRPSRKVMLKHRNAQPKKLFTREEIIALLDAASVPLRAMLLLGVNCAYGPTDVSELRLSSVDLDKGWADFPRPKNGQQRRCKLWRETCDALRAAIAERPKPKEKADADCVFITKYGHRWMNGGTKSVTLEFGKLLKRLGLNGGRGFYCLRHTHRTISDAAKDQPAANLIMGHSDASMRAVYVETIDDSRLEAVAEFVRSWLYSDRVKS